jgi:hypothetical protein
MSAFTISRSTTIAAGPDAVRALVDDFHAWRQWSPWEELDPDLSRSYSGPESGVGARYAWAGNRKAGAGSMEIVASTPASTEIRLEFLKPWRATNPVTFTYEPGDTTTRVTWTMTGTHAGLAKLFARFINVEKLIGPDFEMGLAKLRDLAQEDG